MQPGVQLRREKADEILSTKEAKLYQVMVGALGYLMNCTRPDLAFAVGKVAKFAAYLTMTHMAAVKQIFRYVKGFMNTKHMLTGTNKNLVAYFDASWADNVNDSCSTYGYTILYRNSAMLWKSHKHKGVSLSMTDAEYLAVTETTRDLYWIKNIFDGAKLPFETLIEMRGDTFNANGIASGTIVPNRTRHIEIRERYVSEKVKDGMIMMKWVPTTEQTADIFTKSLPEDIFIKHAKNLGLCFQDHECFVCFTTFHSGNSLHKHIKTAYILVEGIKLS